MDWSFALDVLCIIFCFLHVAVSFFSNLSLKKKVTGLCEKCSQPVYDGLPHDCDLSSEQLKALVSFVLSLKENK